eukprot:TRINITY_DN17946_c0_g1_i1.p1 TRINITY_DN17946_c0_g1~~TRINITY_DN17946_c0_g1_i1.p1  ORF type:complete len:564 (+),score=93.91 TRINITY_DN17946_c0_g1_i1:118-1809(+)
MVLAWRLGFLATAVFLAPCQSLPPKNLPLCKCSDDGPIAMPLEGKDEGCMLQTEADGTIADCVFPDGSFRLNTTTMAACWLIAGSSAAQERSMRINPIRSHQERCSPQGVGPYEHPPLDKYRQYHYALHVFAEGSSMEASDLEDLQEKLSKFGRILKEYYSAEAITMLLGGGDGLGMYPVLEMPEEKLPTVGVDKTADLARLFLLEYPLPRARLVEILGEGLVDMLASMGVLHAFGAMVYPVLRIHSVAGGFFFTDMYNHNLYNDRIMYIGVDSSALASTVYETIGVVDRVLDVCTGSGVQGIAAALAHANKQQKTPALVFTDINSRSQRFVMANLALNSLSSADATWLQGSVYEPLQGGRFDVILANPPYWPTQNSRILFQAGGEYGEDVSRQIYAGASSWLREGGLLFVVSPIFNVHTFTGRLEAWGAKMAGSILHSEPQANKEIGHHYDEAGLPGEKKLTEMGITKSAMYGLAVLSNCPGAPALHKVDLLWFQLSGCGLGWWFQCFRQKSLEMQQKAFALLPKMGCARSSARKKPKPSPWPRVATQRPRLIPKADESQEL